MMWKPERRRHLGSSGDHLASDLDSGEQSAGEAHTPPALATDPAPAPASEFGSRVTDSVLIVPANPAVVLLPDGPAR